MVENRNITVVTVATIPGSMVPERSLLPDVLPTDRLQVGGKPKPPLRDDLRRIPDVRNAITVLSCWAQAIGIAAGAVWVGNPLVWVAALFLMGRSIVMFNILGHEAAHRLLFRNRRLNDFVGRWLLAYPAFQAFDLYRRSHFAHHRDELGPDEPDVGLYAGYPITKASLRRKLARDAFGVSGFKIMRQLLGALDSHGGRPVVLRILAVQGALIAACILAGHPWLYFVLWLVPYLTVWRVLNRLRAIAEHAGMERSDDRRGTTHHVRQSWPARFWMVPYHAGWHLAHHVDMAVPWRNLPRLHDELEAAGWVTPELTYPSYMALWKALASRA